MAFFTTFKIIHIRLLHFESYNGQNDKVYDSFIFMAILSCFRNATKIESSFLVYTPSSIACTGICGSLDMCKAANFQVTEKKCYVLNRSCFRTENAMDWNFLSHESFVKLSCNTCILQFERRFLVKIIYHFYFLRINKIFSRARLFN